VGYRAFVSMNIAVIGTGVTVETFVTSYALAGHEVFLAWKNGDNTGVSPFLYTLDNVHICSIEEAAEVADMIIIATPSEHVREVSYWLGDVRNKIIIDATANLDTVGSRINSAAAIKAITGSGNIVKVFSTRGYETMLQPLFKDENVRLVLAGSSRKAKEAVKILTRDLNVHLFFDMGGDDAIPLLNEMVWAWQNLFARHISTKKELPVKR